MSSGSGGTDRETNTLAMVSMILSIVGIFVSYLPIIGAILGYIALKQIRENPNRYEGEAMAKVGLYLGIGVVIFKIIFVIFIIIIYILFFAFMFSIPFLP